MSHLKRQEVPTTWPISRKGTAYIIKPKFDMHRAMPLLVVLRDLLKIVRNTREIKKAVHEKMILINGKNAKNEKSTVQLFDSIKLVPSNKCYRLALSPKGKFIMEEVKEEDTYHKASKVINKKILRGKKVQLNLNDGRNFLSDIKCDINDSVMIDLRNKKIVKCLPLKEGAKIAVIAGKHLGGIGELTKFKPDRKMASLNINGNKIDVLIKQIMVTG